MPRKKKVVDPADMTPYRASEPTKAPAPVPEHPYDWVVAEMRSVEKRFRTEEGLVSPERIEEHLAECWRTNQPPVIKGLTIGQRVSQ